MRFFSTAAAAMLLLSALGCHSAFIEATIENHTAKPIELVEIDYPSASFGTQALMPGAEFHYRFKVLGTGPTKLLWTDDTHTERTAPGPELRESDEGRLTVMFSPSGPTWQKSLTNHGQPR